MSELVNHPAHYNQGPLEVIDAIEGLCLGFHEGNVVKYVARHRFKGDSLKDLEKAQWYLARLVAHEKRRAGFDLTEQEEELLGLHRVPNDYR